jgi:saccharopine dehydrogenase-like NADP-dependent oxidoreductase
MRILVLGGYGGTGRVFCRYLLKETGFDVIVAGRDRRKAEELAETLKRDFAPERVSPRHVDASDSNSLREGFRGIDFVLVAATTTRFAKAIAEAALEAHIDYLDIYYEQSVYPFLESLKNRITESGQCFITQAGFHPGLPAVFVRKGAAYFDTYDSAIIALAMNTRIEKPESVCEIIDSIADYKSDVFKGGQWRRATYKDAVKIDFGSPFGAKSCFPLEMVEIRRIPEMYPLKEVGVYAAGFNWFVDYILFPLIMLSQKIRKGSLRHFWANAFVWGVNHMSRPDEAVVFVLHAVGDKGGTQREIEIRSEHRSAYDFTVIPVIATLKQYADGSIKKPGLWMMGHIVDPDRLFGDMEQMGVGIETRIVK